ncbi:cytochrome b5-like heme/steroid binding domain-containing protein [Amylocarpus encephaloides]|uniref:Cytochrome b5-like heme/steroid binding domain-containing protein n=1 Tax=Amylocarpus encephaloides TaxID=45428 RepID=A0A9P8C3J7_9HELO|nr:cytochrome b5-like heme/steroid binding domain-containing protein [Amylocarpus encephaloides]
MSKTFTAGDVAEHKDAANGMYIIVDSTVYDVTNFIDEHPGGSKILKRVAGKDASKQFWKYHNEGVLKKYAAKLKVGSVGTGGEKAKL